MSDVITQERKMKNERQAALIFFVQGTVGEVD
jgi:hypothetical protein